MRNRKPLIVFMAILSILASIVAGSISFYLSILNNYWFIPLTVYFFLEAAFIFIVAIQKDEYKGMHILGVFEVVNVILVMCYTLVMVLWNDVGDMDFFWAYVFYIGVIGVKFLTFLISSIAIKAEYNPTLHAFRNNDLLTITYLLMILTLIIFKNIYPITDKIWVYVVEAVVNAVLTTLAAFFALSTIIRSKTHEPLSPVGKIKHTIKWFSDNEINIFFSTIFSFYLATMAFANIKRGFVFWFLGIYYVGMAIIRFINYYWHRKIMKRCGDNKIKENRQSSVILLFDAVVFSSFSIFVAIAASAVLYNKINADTNIYFFLFYIIPLGIFRLITATKNSKRYRRARDTYKLGLSLTSLIASFFSLLEIVAVACHAWPVWAKVVIFIIVVIVVEIAVLVVCVIFVVHFFRSLIINRRSREKKAS